jgi:cobalt-zinc-cadmium efflux system membrane fusion protein
MNSRTKILLGVVGVGCLLVGVLLGRGRSSGQVNAAVMPAAESPDKSETSGTSGSRPLELAAASREKNPVKVASAELARIAGDIQVVGTVAFHEDHYALVGPLVAGRISRLAAGVGDQIHRGQILAEVESAEVGQARADLVAAKARYSAADANLHRETELADKRISSERERELAHAQWVTEQAGVRAATMRLRAIGLSAADIDSLERGDLAGRVPIRAPIGGTVIERKVTLGQAVERATDAFKLADTSRVWVTLDLYEKDLFRVHVGQEVEIWTESRPGESFRGKVAFIVPEIDQATRTAKVRLEFPNPKGHLEAGQLVTARIVADDRHETAEVLAVPRSAVEQIEGKTVVFVQTADGFERRNVLTGASGGSRIEIRQGLALGERVAVEGAFLLKSELLR